MKDKDTVKAFIAACIGMAFFGVTMVALGAVLPSLSEKLGLTPVEKASLAGSLMGGIFLGSIVFGPICDHYGHKGIFLFSSICVLLGLLDISVAPGLLLLIPGYLLIGFGGGVLNGQTNTLVSDLYDATERGGKLSLLGAFYGVGAMAITLLVGVLGADFSFEIILQGISVVLLLGIAFCFTVNFPAPKQAQSFPFRKALAMLKEPVLLLMSLVLMLESTIESVTNNLSTTYFGNNFGSASEVVLLLTVMMASLTAARFMLSWLAHVFSPQILLYIFLTLLFTGFALAAISGNIAMATVAMVLVGLGAAAAYPVILGQLGTKYSDLSGTAFGIAITIALAGSTLFNALIGGLLLSVYPYVMMGGVLLMLVLYTLGNRSLEIK